MSKTPCFRCGKASQYFGVNLRIPLVSSHRRGYPTINVPVICKTCYEEFMSKFVKWFRSGLDEQSEKEKDESSVTKV